MFTAAHYDITNNRYVRNEVSFLKCFKTYYTSLLYGSYNLIRSQGVMQPEGIIFMSQH